MSNNKIKVLAYCDAACATGFSTVAMNILVGLYNTGLYDIVVLGINHHGFPHAYPFPIYPVGVAGSQDRDPYGRKWVASMMNSQEFDILFTIQDSFILEFMKDVIGDVRNKNPKVRWITYFPVDAKPKRRWLDAMSLADCPVTYTKWGKEVCEEVCPSLKDRLKYIYHGVNTKDFFPTPLSETNRFRRDYFGPLANKYIVTNVNRNQQRKDIPRSMVAFKEFNKKHPDTLLYCHMATVDHGWNLVEVAGSIGLEINEHICFPENFGPNQGFPKHILNLLYNSSDVVISSTTGEGWGLSATEAMACCRPVIFPDNTACSEIIGENRGLLVKSGEDLNHHTVLPNDNEVLRKLVNIDDMVDKMCYLYDNRGEAQKLALNGYKWVTSSLRWDKNIVPQWLELFDEVYKSKEINLTSGSELSLIEM